MNTKNNFVIFFLSTSIPLKARFFKMSCFYFIFKQQSFPLRLSTTVALLGHIIYTPMTGFPDTLYYLSNGTQNFEHSL